MRSRKIRRGYAPFWRRRGGPNWRRRFDATQDAVDRVPHSGNEVVLTPREPSSAANVVYVDETYTNLDPDAARSSAMITWTPPPRRGKDGRLCRVRLKTAGDDCADQRLAE